MHLPEVYETFKKKLEDSDDEIKFRGGLFVKGNKIALDCLEVKNRSRIRINTFVSSESTSSTNDVSTSYGVSTSSSYNSQRENSSSYTDELMYSFFANQSSGPHLDHKDLEQLDEFDLEEMDLKWQGSILLERYLSKGNQESRRRYAGNTGYRAKDNGRRPGKQEEPKALVTLDGEGVDWTGHAKDEQENFALMAYSNSGSDTEVHLKTLKTEAQRSTHFGRRIQEKKIFYLKAQEVRRTFFKVRRTFL
ncbi:hypothetical protein Tco_1263336 [Tanacetum coccineum]